MANAPLIPIQDITVYNGNINSNVKLLGVVNNTDTRLLPFNTLTASFPTLWNTIPAGPTSAGWPDSIRIDNNVLYSRTSFGWGASPRYSSNWQDLSSSTRFLLVNTAEQNLTEAEILCARTNLKLQNATEETEGLVRPGEGLDVNNGVLSVVQATASKKGITWLDNSSEPNNSAASLAFVSTAVSNIYDTITNRPFPVATTTELGGIIASASVNVDSTGVATVPEATTTTAGIVKKWDSSASTTDDIRYITYQQATQIAVAKINAMVPVATTSVAGKVIAGSGLSVTTNGTLAVLHAIPRPQLAVSVANNNEPYAIVTNGTDVNTADTYGLFGSVLPVASMLDIDTANVDPILPYVPTVLAVKNYVQSAILNGGTGGKINRAILPVAGNDQNHLGAVYGTSTVQISDEGAASVRIATTNNTNPGLVYVWGDVQTIPDEPKSTVPTVNYVNQLISTRVATAATLGTVRVALSDEATEQGQALSTVPTNTRLNNLISSLTNRLDDFEERSVTIMPVASDDTLGGIKVGEPLTGEPWPSNNIPLHIDREYIYLDAEDLPATGNTGTGAGTSFTALQEVVKNNQHYIEVDSAASLVVPEANVDANKVIDYIQFPSAGTSLYKCYNGVYISSTEFGIGREDTRNANVNTSLFFGQVGVDGTSGSAMTLTLRSIPSFDAGYFTYTELTAYSFAIRNRTKAAVDIGAIYTDAGNAGHITITDDTAAITITPSSITYNATDDDINAEYTFIPDQDTTIATKKEVEDKIQNAIDSLDLSQIKVDDTTYTFPTDGTELASKTFVATQITANSTHFANAIDENYHSLKADIDLLASNYFYADGTTAGLLNKIDPYNHKYYSYPASSGELATEESVTDRLEPVEASINEIELRINSLEENDGISLVRDYVIADVAKYATLAGGEKKEGTYKVVMLNSVISNAIKQMADIQSITLYHAGTDKAFTTDAVFVNLCDVIDNNLRVHAYTSSSKSLAYADAPTNAKTTRWEFTKEGNATRAVDLSNLDGNIYLLLTTAGPLDPSFQNYTLSDLISSTRTANIRISGYNDATNNCRLYTSGSNYNDFAPCITITGTYSEEEKNKIKIVIGSDNLTNGGVYLCYQELDAANQIVKYCKSYLTDMTNTLFPQP